MQQEQITPALPSWALSNNLPDDMLLCRKRAARLLSGLGYPIAPATLAKYATTGGGPPYFKFGRLVRFRTSDLRLWAENRLGGRYHSTADYGVEATA